MSSFACPVVRVQIEPHENADALEIALVGGYRAIVKKGQFKSGDLAIYVPEDSVLPDWLLKLLGFWDDMKLKGTLSNAAGNRVRAMKLRGVVSQGLVVPIPKDTDGNYWLPLAGEHPEIGVDYDRSQEFPTEGQDYASRLEIVKYEVPIPAHLAGKVAGADLDACFLYDFDNIKARSHMFNDEDTIQITEKLHGTQFQCGLIPVSIWAGKNWAEKSPLFDCYRGTVTSKGLSKQGLLLDPSDFSNVYVRAAVDQNLWLKLLDIAKKLNVEPNEPIFIFGEIYGGGIQRGFSYDSANTHTFKAFDIAIGGRNNHRFLTGRQFLEVTQALDIATVPLLYKGPYIDDVVKQFTDGPTLLGGHHIREGVVLKCWHENYDKKYGRRIVKSVSNAYLLDKKGTDFQ